MATVVEAAEELLRRRRARSSFLEFARAIAPDEPPARHHEILCSALDEIISGTLRRLMVFMPPGSAKSTYASVRFPAYYVGKFARKNIICASYSDELATSFGRKVRNLVGSPEYQRIFPKTTLAQDSKARGEWETAEGATYLACGVGGSITGRRCDLGLIDDPVKGRKEADSELIKNNTWQWYLSDFLSRLKPGAAQVIIQTRWTEDDLSGRILPSTWDGESGDFEGFDGQIWRVICLQAEAEEGKNDPLGRKPGEWLWPEWFTTEYWVETKAAQTKEDMRNWSALYQQRPSPDDGDYFRREWFRWYRSVPAHLNYFITHDDGVTDDGDPTEIGVFGIDPAENVYAIDWWSGQETADIWVDQIIDLIDKYKPISVVGETGPIRASVEPFLRKRMDQRKIYARLEWLPTIGDKAARARGFQALAASGKVYLPEGKDWSSSLLSQLVRFPAGARDDKVDTCGLMGRAINQAWAASVPSVRSQLPITAKPTLSEMLARQPKRKPASRRI